MLLLVLAAFAAPLAAQPSVHPADRQLARIGIGIGTPEASGVSIWTPNASYGVPCVEAYGSYYECGGMAVAFLSDGEYEYDILSSHTWFFSPASQLDPYITLYTGFGYGDEFGIAWGAEFGTNIWLVPNGGITVYGGAVRGERSSYVRLGLGLVIDTSQ